MSNTANFLCVAGIVEDSITDGPGLRLTVFTQGCEHHCPGCHNPSTHPLDGGEWRSIEDIFALYMSNPLLAGITFSGGEPFLQPHALAALARLVHSAGGNVITYTGYVLEELQRPPLGENPGVLALLEQTDMLIDGPFIAGLASLELKFRGSSNQRILRHTGRDFVPTDL